MRESILSLFDARAMRSPLVRKRSGDVNFVRQVNPAPLEQVELALIYRYWSAANYLSVGQIYLLDNPLLRDPLRPEHVKPRLLGQLGTTPSLNFIYAHLNRVIRACDLATLRSLPCAASARCSLAAKSGSATRPRGTYAATRRNP